VTRPRLGGMAEGVELTCGAHVSVAGERDGGLGEKGATQKGRRKLENTP
jgi:hypothetical protein